MNETSVIIYLAFGLILRIGVPVGLTLLLGWFVHRLDARWQAEAKETKKTLIELKRLEPVPPCWEYMNCPPSIRDNCPVYGQTEISCWEYFNSNGAIRSSCQECTYRRTILSKRKSLVSITGD